MDSGRNGDEIRVLLVVQEDVLRRGLLQILQSDPGIHIITELDPGEFPGGASAAPGPSCVLVGDPAREEMLREIGTRAFGNGSRVLATGYCGAREALMAIAAGASGFVDARSDSPEIIRAVRTVALGGFFVPPPVLACLVQEFWRISKVALEAAPSGENFATGGLTSREEEVAELLVRGYSNREIAERLSISEKTVKNHVSSILRKLGLPGRGRVAAWALGRELIGLKAH